MESVDTMERNVIFQSKSDKPVKSIKPVEDDLDGEPANSPDFVDEVLVDMNPYLAINFCMVSNLSSDVIQVRVTEELYANTNLHKVAKYFANKNKQQQQGNGQNIYIDDSKNTDWQDFETINPGSMVQLRNDNDKPNIISVINTTRNLVLSDNVEYAANILVYTNEGKLSYLVNVMNSNEFKLKTGKKHTFCEVGYIHENIEKIVDPETGKVPSVVCQNSGCETYVKQINTVNTYFRCTDKECFYCICGVCAIRLLTPKKH